MIYKRRFHFLGIVMKLISYYQSVTLRKVIFFVVISVFIYSLCYFNFSNPNYELNDNETEWKYYLLEEIRFPIAFTISFYRDPEQFLHLFRAIYRPFNLYCLHVDLKSDKNVHDLALDLSRKYKNVILPKKFIKVVHSEFSVLMSELLCMEALYADKNIKWKYLINLTGQEWPLKVNLELVRILKTLRGANLIEKIEYAIFISIRNYP